MTATLLPFTAINAPVVHCLSNGLTIIAEQMPIEAVNLNIWLKVGSALETDEINGMSHFLEHMVFKGTSRLKIGEFERLVEARGAVINAATSQEYTHYYITTAPKDFTQLAPMQLDVVLNPLLADEAFERERSVILEEIRRSEDNPRRRLFYRAMETCFDRLPYRRPVLGPTTIIEALTAQQMRDFHTNWYQPQLMTAAVVGNLPVDELIEIVTNALEKRYSENASSAQSDFLDVLTPELPFKEIIRREYEDEKLQQARMLIAWRVPGLRELAQTYALDILAVILGQGKVSRLFRELREEKGLVSQISVSNMTHGIQGIFAISVQLPAENIPPVEAAIIQHIRQIQQNSVTATELARVRTQIANRFIFSNERPSDRANLYGYYYSQVGDLESALNYPNSIQSLEIEDIQAATQRYLSPDAYGIVIMKPTN